MKLLRSLQKPSDRENTLGGADDDSLMNWA